MILALIRVLRLVDSKSTLSVIWKFDLADFLHAFSQREAVERVDAQAGENLDAIVQLGEDSQKKSVRGFRRADKGGWIGHSPMGGDWLSGPYRTRLGRRLVADRENKIERRTFGPREFLAIEGRPGLGNRLSLQREATNVR